MLKWLSFIAVLLVAFAVGATIYLQPSDFLACHEKPIDEIDCSKADAIVVVSGGNTLARTESGVKLFKDGWAEYLVFSGAARDKSGPSNAAEMRRVAIDSGVPAGSIIIDEDSETTRENAEKTADIFKQYKFSSVILVTSGYHQRRASLEFNKLANGLVIRNSPVYDDGDWGWWWWLTPRGWWLATSEVAKIIVFYMGSAT